MSAKRLDVLACALSALASPASTTLMSSEQRKPSCQPEVFQRASAGVKRTGLGAVYADGGCPEAAVFERTFLSWRAAGVSKTEGETCRALRRTFASLSAARCADILGCSAMPSRLLACGSADREHERLGSAMSC